MSAWPRYMSVCHVCATVHKDQSEEGIGSPGNKVINGCELPCEGWDLNSGPLEEQPAL